MHSWTSYPNESCWCEVEKERSFTVLWDLGSSWRWVLQQLHNKEAMISAFLFFQTLLGSKIRIFKKQSKNGLNIKRETELWPYDSLTSFALYCLIYSLAFQLGWKIFGKGNLDHLIEPYQVHRNFRSNKYMQSKVFMCTLRSIFRKYLLNMVIITFETIICV